MFAVLTLGLADENDQKGTPIETSEAFETRGKAKGYLRRQVEKFEAHGYNTERDYWWARSKADKYSARRFFIQSVT
jgi:hypothetical protein